MVADREPHRSNEPREQVIRVHDVDGITFIVFEHHIEGSGWQGRGFRFPSGEMEVMKRLLGRMPETPINGSHDSRIIVNKETDNEDVAFNIHQDGSWINSADDSKKRGISLATADIPALIHVLGELDNLNQSDDPHSNHFCDEYGVEDDD